MSTTNNQKCPLCGSAAEYEMIAGGQSKHFHCKNCVEFVITIEAERKLNDFVGSSLKKLASEASEITKLQDFVLFIKCAEVPPKHQSFFAENQRPPDAECHLQGTPVERHKIPLR